MVMKAKSCFRNELINFRDIRIAAGIKNVSIERYINFFDDFILNENVNEIKFTKDMISRWIKQRPEEGEVTRYIRVNWSIQFLTYLKGIGYDVEIPRRLPWKPSNFQAYIYSQEEIDKYFEYIDNYYNKDDPMVALYTPIIFRILYSCGTRIGETLSLKVKDVDLQMGILYLKNTKNGKHRMVPISDSLHKLLILYSNKCIYLKNENDYFFSHIDRRRVSEHSVYLIHRHALEAAGIPYVGSGKGPRVHDWRHTMAVESLNKFEKEGCDLANILPILKQYLGHSSICATEKYLRLVTQHYDELLNKSKVTEMYINEENI